MPIGVICTSHKTTSEFLTGERECSQFCERLRSCYAMEHSMVMSSTLFECGPFPPYIHLVPPNIFTLCVPRPSPFFSAFPHPCITLNVHRITKNEGGLKTRLDILCFHLHADNTNVYSMLFHMHLHVP